MRAALATTLEQSDLTSAQKRIQDMAWCHLVKNFGKLFRIVAGKRNQIDGHRSKTGSHKNRARRAVRELLSSV